MNLRVDRSDGFSDGVLGVLGVLDEPDGEGDGDALGVADVAASALSTAPSSRGRLCAAPPALSAVANCQAPSAPAAVPTPTHAAVTTALRHFLIRPLCRTVS
ncbi:hypothetical protein [Streptomyces sp. NPDC002855]|uniref:hypothetical protein n=1 Tax=Streptomyces sp. NPDC002855 TaxID=3154437 RepID=UPI003322B267